MGTRGRPTVADSASTVGHLDSFDNPASMRRGCCLSKQFTARNGKTIHRNWDTGLDFASTASFLSMRNILTLHIQSDSRRKVDCAFPSTSANGRVYYPHQGGRNQPSSVKFFCREIRQGGQRGSVVMSNRLRSWLEAHSAFDWTPTSNSMLILQRGPFTKDVMVVLGESVCLVSHVLKQP